MPAEIINLRDFKKEKIIKNAKTTAVAKIGEMVPCEKCEAPTFKTLTGNKFDADRYLDYLFEEEKELLGLEEETRAEVVQRLEKLEGEIFENGRRVDNIEINLENQRLKVLLSKLQETFGFQCEHPLWSEVEAVINGK